MNSGKINVTRIDKTKMFRGKQGVYLDIICFPLKNGEDSDGNTHVIMQSLPKEDRDRGEKGAMLGRMRIENNNISQPKDHGPSTAPDTPTPEDDDVPF